MATQWNERDVSATRNANLVRARIYAYLPEWRRVWCAQGLEVFCNAGAEGTDRIHLLDNGEGLIVGTLFKTRRNSSDDTYARVDTLSARESEEIRKNGPRYLIDAYWGWYVAFVKNGEKSLTWVLRSPMSDLPCLYFKNDSVNMFFSRVEDCVALRLGRFSIDWVLLQLHVGMGEAALHGQSAIREISVVEGGEAFEVHDGASSRIYHWSPPNLARSAPIDDPRAINESFRRTVRSCVQSWASLHPSILVRLSGGFDSSLVLACLADAPSTPRVTALNFWEEGEADERGYARSMAHHVKADLVELRFGTTESLERVKLVTRTAAPITDVIDWQERVREQEIARRYAATAIFTGVQGDALFEHWIPLSSFCDYLSLHGLRMSALRVAMDLGLRDRVSIWRVFAASLRAAFSTPRRGPWSLYADTLSLDSARLDRLLVRDDAVADFRRNLVRHTHPWLRDIEGIPFGKLSQMAQLFSGSCYDDQFRGSDDVRNMGPFLSQPLAEFCLRIPSYRSVEGGVTRSVARQAFAKDLPERVLRRQGKGHQTPWLRSMIERDGKFVRAFLLDGLLAEKGILDRDKLQRALPGDVSPRASHPGGTMDLLYAEAWARAWAAAPRPEVRHEVTEPPRETDVGEARTCGLSG